ncbi:MAG: DUF362 domain-containing protein, partial [Firmicutes bacterium]|nr:DUF362 domain-containing protein [Bacillota bacterium]
LPDDPSLSEQVAAMRKLCEHAGMARIIAPHDFVAIKTHVGEKHNTTHIKPELIRVVVEAVRAVTENVFLTETSTLYKGERDNAVKHLLHAHAHGFGIERVGAPFIMADGLTGGSEVEVEVDGELEKTVKIAREVAFADVLIAVSHPTGHMVTGLGACRKNLGMGLASRAGKLRQHSSVSPTIKENKCRYCRKCIQWCPAAAITERKGKAFIHREKCTGCGECLTVCRYDAVGYDWGAGSERLQKSMVEHALGVLKGKDGKSFFFNVLVDMTADCDCTGRAQRKIMPDVGVLAATDPVAIDAATLDLTRRYGDGRTLAEKSYAEIDPLVQLRHAEKLGMGSMNYELVSV